MNILNILLLTSALGLSAVAAFFSIIGIATMFPGAVTAVIVMAVALEIAKIISAVWTHKNWHEVSLFSKSYLSFAIFILMLITSMGIFGFLSKAHIEHQSVSESIQLQVSQIDAKILREQESIKRNEDLISKIENSFDSVEDKDQSIISENNTKIDSIYTRMEKDIEIDQKSITSLNQRVSELDSALSILRAEKGGLFSNQGKKIQELQSQQKDERDRIEAQILSYTSNISDLRKKAQLEVDEIRKQNVAIQNKEYKNPLESDDIAKYKNIISTSYSSIDDLNLQKFELSNKNLAIETEVGPVKYVAELIVDTTGSEIDLSDAVRLIIIVIIFVFDPLAIMMIVCASSGFVKKNKILNNDSNNIVVKKPPAPKKEVSKALMRRVKATPKEKVGYVKEDPKPDPKPEPKPDPKPDPKPEPKPEPKPKNAPNKVSIVRSQPDIKTKDKTNQVDNFEYKKHSIT